MEEISPTPKRGIVLDDENKIVWVEGRQIEMTVDSYRLLRLFVQRANQLVTHNDICRMFYNQSYDRTVYETWLYNCISRLRERIEPNPERPKYLKTVRGKGYRLEPAPAPDTQ
jgi:DNA-binding response OmpR family regulator